MKLFTLVLVAAIAMSTVLSAQQTSPKKKKSQRASTAKSAARISNSISSSTSCLRYAFKQFDSLVYRGTCIDTIQFVEAPWLIKKHEFTVSLVCDFVDERGRMFLRQDLRSYHGSEIQQGDSSVVETNNSPWQARTIYFIIDSTGNRIVARQIDTLHPMISPLGAYQTPLILSLLDTNCHNSSMHNGWMMGHTDTLAENGFPYPLMRNLFNCKMRDTMLNKEACYTVSFGQTAQASQKTLVQNLGVYSRSVINSWGSMTFAAQQGLPLLLNVHSDLKLWVETAQSKQRGEERCHTRYECIYRSPRTR